MDFTSVQHGTLPTGTVTDLGVIEASSLTAYRIDGEWVPFCRIHGQRRPVLQPLVACAEWLPRAS